MKHHVIIETHRMEDGAFRAYAVDSMLVGCGLLAVSPERELTYAAAVVQVESRFPHDAFSFLHAET